MNLIKSHELNNNPKEHVRIRLARSQLGYFLYSLAAEVLRDLSQE